MSFRTFRTLLRNSNTKLIRIDVRASKFDVVVLTEGIMAHITRKINALTKKYPVTRGMLTYSILWPTSNICQQVFIREEDEFDYYEPLRFSLFGCFYTAPTLYAWVRISSYLFPGGTYRVAITKAIVEQFTYAPFAITSFYLGMGLLEGRSLDAAAKELKQKFMPTYKTALCFWPAFQAINFSFVPERNRVPVVATASFFWGMFLSYMKHKHIPKEED